MTTPPILHAKDGSQEHETPRFLFDHLNERFGPFHIDCAASHTNHLCENYFTKETNGLLFPWTWTVYDWYAEGCGRQVCTNTFTNPPYEHPTQAQFIKKNRKEGEKGLGNKVLLIPARPDTQSWQEEILNVAAYIIFIKGRLHYSYCGDPAGFPSAIVVHNNDLQQPTVYETLDLKDLKGYEEYEAKWKENKRIMVAEKKAKELLKAKKIQDWMEAVDSAYVDLSELEPHE